MKGSRTVKRRSGSTLPTYKLDFHPKALREWKKLGAPVREQARRKLDELLLRPHVPAARIRGEQNAYRIKLRAAGYRLIYRVEDDRLIVYVVAVEQRDSGKRDAYDVAIDRLARLRD